MLPSSFSPASQLADLDVEFEDDVANIYETAEALSSNVGVQTRYGCGAYYPDQSVGLNNDRPLKFLSNTAAVPPGVTQSNEKPLTVVTLHEAIEIIQCILDETAELLDVEVNVAAFLLRQFGWRSAALATDFLDNPRRVYLKAGLPEKYAESSPTPANLERRSDSPPVDGPPATSERTFMCPILAVETPCDETTLLPHCNHRLSNACWMQYLEMSVLEEGSSACLSKRCPMFKCGVLVPHSFWKKFLSEDSFKKYLRYFFSELINSNPNLQTCPSPNCDRVIKRSTETASMVEAMPLTGGHDSCTCSFFNDVTCLCGTRFCFTCCEPAHSPASCHVCELWTQKDRNEREDVLWIVLHTKSCPNCKNPIQKDQGCMHMTCRCSHQFCWLCLANWAEHTTCNRFVDDPSGIGIALSEAAGANVNEGSSNTNEAAPITENLDHVRGYMDRYTHCVSRFTAHQHGERVARTRQMPTVRSQMKFLTESSICENCQYLEEAVEQIIECRRFLKWSYAFAYYADWTHHPEGKELFEHHQGELERNLDRLQELSEKFTPPEVPLNPRAAEWFVQFQNDLVNLTHVVGRFFDRMSMAFKTEFKVNFVQPTTPKIVAGPLWAAATPLATTATSTSTPSSSSHSEIRRN